MMYRLLIGCITLFIVHDRSFISASDLPNTSSSMCTCNVDLFSARVRDDYIYTPGIGAHKLHTRATTWNNARKVCNEEGGHLAIINSDQEANILLGLFNNSGFIKGARKDSSAFLGIHDLYKEDDWVTILGDPLPKTGYTRWSDKWIGQSDNRDGIQHCGSLMQEGGLDDVDCNAIYPFFCELPLMQVVPLRQNLPRISCQRFTTASDTKHCETIE